MNGIAAAIDQLRMIRAGLQREVVSTRRQLAIHFARCHIIDARCLACGCYQLVRYKRDAFQSVGVDFKLSDW